MADNIEDEENTFKILVSTDNHLGYMDKDVVRANDSMNTFEEIMKIACDNKVDLVLLGGDLFHENKPSRHTMHGAMRILRQYCHGDRPVSIEFLSDPSVNFGHTPNPIVNYEDPNLNISLPVFLIHGNHDDPAGPQNLCCSDLLHTAGLLNYFGKITNLETIEMSPMLMRKGSTMLALYGLGSIKDERLYRIFTNKNVKMLRPLENQESWFNILVLHQNRAKHGPTNYIPEQFLDNFLDLIIWGHEHECKIDPMWNGNQEFYVSQPGSSIATSMSEGESVEKHVGLLFIRGRNFKMKKIPLHTVRPFFMEDISLLDSGIKPGDQNAVQKIETFFCEIVDQMIEKAERQRKDNPKAPIKPLIRLRVDYSAGNNEYYELFSTHRFAQKYVDKVANPKDIFLFQKRKPQVEKNSTGKMKLAEMKTEQLMENVRVEDMVRDFLINADKNMRLCVLTENGMSEALREYVLKDEREAIPELVKYQLQKTQKHLISRKVGEDLVVNELLRFKDERMKDEVLNEEMREVLCQARAKRMNEDDDTSEILDDDDDEHIELNNSTASLSRGRGGRARGRGTSGGRGSRGGSKGKNAKQSKIDFSTSRNKYEDADDVDIDDLDSDMPLASKGPKFLEKLKPQVMKKVAYNKNNPIAFSDSDDGDNNMHRVSKANAKKKKF